MAFEYDLCTSILPTLFNYWKLWLTSYPFWKVWMDLELLNCVSIFLNLGCYIIWDSISKSLAPFLGRRWSIFHITLNKRKFSGHGCTDKVRPSRSGPTIIWNDRPILTLQEKRKKKKKHTHKHINEILFKKKKRRGFFEDIFSKYHIFTLPDGKLIYRKWIFYFITQ